MRAPRGGQGQAFRPEERMGRECSGTAVRPAGAHSASSGCFRDGLQLQVPGRRHIEPGAPHPEVPGPDAPPGRRVSERLLRAPL